MDISIVIVNWNTRDILRDCLRSVYEETQDVEYEIIVVDNDSSDGSSVMVKAEFPQVILIENSENCGFAVANNQGIAIAKGRYILLLNSDTIVLDGAITKTVEFADEHPSAGVVSCQVLNEDKTVQPNCSMFPSITNWFLMVSFLYKVLPGNKFFGRANYGGWEYDSEREVEVVSGCFMLVRVEAVEKVGWMDERFFMYSEEVDWCWRFKESGWKVLFTGCAQIVHYGNVSAVKHGADRAVIKDKSTVRFMFKNWPKSRAYVGVFMLLLFYVSRLPSVFLVSVFKRCEESKRLLANHIFGLWGVLRFGRYL